MRLIFTVVLSMLMAGSVYAQTFEQLSSLRLGEPPASARGAAMGAVAVPAATDASAMDANPAALGGLEKVTVALGASTVSYDTVGFRTQGNSSLMFDDRNTATGLSHASAAIPFGDFAFGVWYRHDPDIRAGDPFTLDAREVSHSLVECGDDCSQIFTPGGFALQRRERRAGVAAAWKGSTVAIGVGAELRELDESVELPRMSFIATSPFLAAEAIARRSSGRDVAMNAGVLWHVMPRLALAASYNGSVSFERSTSACALADIESFVCASERVDLDRSTVDAPDAFRAGVSYRATDRLLFAAEAVYRAYGRLADEPYSIIGTATTLPYRDGTELHAGAEYVVPARVPVALRAGWWRDPARFTGAPAWGSGELRRSIDHLTFGAGLDFGEARLDVAFDTAGDSAVRRATVALTHTF